MPTFDSDGVPIHYELHGTGKPLMLVHGLTVSFERNFRAAGWVEPLNKAGFQVIGLDLRGHGASGKPRAQTAYGLANFARDVLRLVDHLNLDRPDLMGYSLGGHVALYLASQDAASSRAHGGAAGSEPATSQDAASSRAHGGVTGNEPVTSQHGPRFHKIVVGGIGDAAIGHGAHTQVAQQIMDALAADDPASVADPTIRTYRTWAAQPPNDLHALRAAAREPFANHDLTRVRAIQTPVLVILGEHDSVAGEASQLAAAIPGAQFVVIPGRNHFNAVGDYRYKEAVIKFLTQP